MNDGTKFQSVASNTGDCFVSATGRIVCNSYAKQLTGLSDVGSSTAGAGRLLINDGADFNSIAMSGDATITSAGVIDLASSSVGAPELSSYGAGQGFFTAASFTVDADGRIVQAAQGSLTGLSDIGSATITAGRILIADGTNFESTALSGHCTVNASGYVNCNGLTAAKSLTGLTDVGSATITAGRLLIADGTKYQAVAMSGDCTLDSAGAIDCPTGSGATFLTGLSDVGSATITAGFLLIADGTDYQSVAVSGDVTITSAGVVEIGSAKVGAAELSSTAVVSGFYTDASFTVDADGRIVSASQGSLTGLSDIGSATITAGNLLIADGTDFQSVAISGDISITSAGAVTVLASSSSTGGWFENQATNDVYLINNAVGQVGIGTTTPTEKLVISGSDADFDLLSGDDNESTTIHIFRAKGSIAAPTVVADSDTLGAIEWRGYDGDQYITSGAIAIKIEGTPGDNDMPTRMMFYTTNDGASVHAERIRIMPDGTVGIGTSTPQYFLDVNGAAMFDGNINMRSGVFAPGLTGLSDIGSATITAGRLLISDGTKYQSAAMSGDCTITSAGVIDCPSAVGATQLTGLSDVGSATVTAGRLLIADGTKFQSVAYSGPAGVTLSAAGAETGIIDRNIILFATATTNINWNEPYNGNVHKFLIWTKSGTATADLKQCGSPHSSCGSLLGSTVSVTTTPQDVAIKSAASAITGKNYLELNITATTTNEIEAHVGISR